MTLTTLQTASMLRLEWAQPMERGKEEDTQVLLSASHPQCDRAVQSTGTSVQLPPFAWHGGEAVAGLLARAEEQQLPTPL